MIHIYVKKARKLSPHTVPPFCLIALPHHCGFLQETHLNFVGKCA